MYLCLAVLRIWELRIQSWKTRRLTNTKKGLEKELEDFLMNVEGVGDVKVLIYMKSSQEFIVEKNNPTSSSTSGDSSDLKKEESTVYTTNANGDEVPFISQTKGPALMGWSLRQREHRMRQ